VLDRRRENTEKGLSEWMKGDEEEKGIEEELWSVDGWPEREL